MNAQVRSQWRPNFEDWALKASLLSYIYTKYHIYTRNVFFRAMHRSLKSDALMRKTFTDPNFDYVQQLMVTRLRPRKWLLPTGAISISGISLADLASLHCRQGPANRHGFRLENCQQWSHFCMYISWNNSTVMVKLCQWVPVILIQDTPNLWSVNFYLVHFQSAK